MRFTGVWAGVLITGNEDGAKALLNEHPLLVATSRLRDPTAS